MFLVFLRNPIGDTDSCPDNPTCGFGTIAVNKHIFYIFQVEGLMDDIDFKAKVTRTEFEELCADLFERVPRPVQEALTAAEMKLVSMWGDVAVGRCRHWI